MNPTRMLAAAAIVAAFASPSRAEIIDFAAELSGAKEVPAVATPASGTASVRLDTSSRQLSWIITFSGLTSQATAWHFHGPAGPTANAPIVLSIPGGGAQSGQFTGTATITAQQVRDVQAGRWYINGHTATYPGGELRGQVLRR